FATQKTLLDAAAPWLPPDAKVILMADRFYGTPDLIGWCKSRGWDYRLRLKGNLTAYRGGKKVTMAGLA
ncbi:transposase, partial [Magnetospirillum sp. SS-4]|uniref:transposase n=1 Tax=Magnetospirillum sp. SS-4 TaxID=2681465 RepID=UPI001572D4E8